MVQDMLAKRTMELVVSKLNGFYACLFLLHKLTGGWRPVFDLSNLSKFLVPKETVPGHGAGFSKGSGFSMAKKGQLISVCAKEFSRSQSPYGVSMEFTPGSSGFLGETGPG
ncbi:hypothetical protein E2C01_084236 [Portunus trituberculatus]|uniref:Uncharacterized protein n=1 Tax=Portunus trituberculatus TaxID=210409 RepID=A0A5B7J6X6_PORTR|nr:hypothetical protein [Portunus trituberculatus]